MVFGVTENTPFSVFIHNYLLIQFLSQREDMLNNLFVYLCFLRCLGE